MTTYRVEPEQESVFEAWAVIATGIDGRGRFVARYISYEKARTMIVRLEAMAEALKVELAQRVAR